MFRYQSKILVRSLARTGMFRSGQSIRICSETSGRSWREIEMGNLDGRVRRTRESLHKALILLALEKKYDAITVQEVLDRAHVGRRARFSNGASLTTTTLVKRFVNVVLLCALWGVHNSTLRTT
jgi:hypothetical protein